MKRNRSQAGFTLIEMLLVVLILTIVTGAIFQQINTAQQRYRTETAKLDITQQAREFIDGTVRDLHQSGYPNLKMSAAGLQLNNASVAAGLVSISETAILFEGDVDNDGAVDSVQYEYIESGTGCPCIRRSQVTKTAGWPWGNATAVYYTDLRDVEPIDGVPVFSAFNAAGDEVTLPLVLGSGSTVDAASQSAIKNIKTIKINIAVQASINDATTDQAIQVAMTGSARVNQ